MISYEKLDFLIFESIKKKAKGFSELFCGEVFEEAIRLAKEWAQIKSDRDAFRFVDARLQSLRKRGLIEFKGGVWRTPMK